MAETLSLDPRGRIRKVRQEHNEDHATLASVTATFPEKQSLPTRYPAKQQPAGSPLSPNE